MRLAAFFLSALLLFGCAGDNGSTPESESTSEDPIYSSGDTLVVLEEAKIAPRPERTDWLDDLQIGDTVSVTGIEDIDDETWLRVHHDGVQGWMSENYEFSKPEYYRSLREDGFEVIVVSHRFSKNRQNVINLHAYIANVTRSMPVNTVEFTWKLFDESGDPASTDIYDGNTLKTTHEGLFGTSIKPGYSTATGSEIGYSPEGSCAEIHGIKVELSDGGTSVYSGESLRKITQRAEDVRLAGECR
jgi:hypothetical protein